MVQEFKEFIARGNMIELAVGFIMGAAFTAIVNGLVEHIIMPIIAIPFGEPSFDHLIWTVNGSQILIGSFITAIITFLGVALGTFLFVVKPYNALKARQERTEVVEEEAAPSEIDLLIEIRDSLRRQ